MRAQLLLASEGPNRPGKSAWDTAIRAIVNEYETKGWVDDETLEAAGVKLGVSRRTVSDRLGEHHRRTATLTSVRLTPAEIVAASGAGDFGDAIAVLRALGNKAPTAALVSGLWNASGISLEALRKRERVRRSDSQRRVHHAAQR